MPATEPRVETFQRDGLTFEVTDSGPLDGTPVVLLHGFPTDRTSWTRITDRLADAGCRTWAPDQRGYSPEATPPSRSAYRLEELVADALALVDATGHERVHLAGHDWGGAIAWLVAGNAAERIASLTVLSTPHPAALSRALRTPDQLRRSWYMGAFQVPWVPEHVFAAGFRRIMRGSGLPAEDVERYAARLGHADALTGPINWYRATGSSHVRAHRVTVPTTYVWGRDDVALGRHAAELTREHVTGPYAFLEVAAGHWLPETRAEECATAILARIASTQGG
ncbi:alpha/beta hydrolase [Intrasporangium oryzae NRRL B-24470]|uniref:Alpha/beta hydrolase n=1 Tax=Intrasporangium oryzae NRRL B-24470 TaxID=1386089 RepID=W9G8T1_9MICO|nr:alpha/beta fold hydrolase [Intrasporangium oryzae]EWT01233.1 alpha/beta hydrolase [Intrasporangium oryzae NRRL B-24470]